jgi:hypothetical protein
MYARGSLRTCEERLGPASSAPFQAAPEAVRHEIRVPNMEIVIQVISRPRGGR